MVPAVLHRWPYVVLLLLSLLLALVGPAPVAQNRQAEPDLAELLSRPTASFAERKRLVEDCLRAGMLYEERGRQRSALLVYGHALQIWPNHPEILPHYQRLGRGISAQEPAPDPDAAAALEARQRMEAQRARAAAERRRLEQQQRQSVDSSHRDRLRRSQLAARRRAAEEARLQREKEAREKAERLAREEQQRLEEMRIRQELALRQRLERQRAAEWQAALQRWLMAGVGGVALLALLGVVWLIGRSSLRRGEQELSVQAYAVNAPPDAPRHPVQFVLDQPVRDLELPEAIPELDLATRMQVLDRLESYLKSEGRPSSSFLETLTPLLADSADMTRVRARRLLDEAVQREKAASHGPTPAS